MADGSDWPPRKVRRRTMDRQSNSDRAQRGRRRRKMASSGEWGEETTSVYGPGSLNDGAATAMHGQSLDAIFERARSMGWALPTPFIFALYVQSCAELAGAGRRPPRHKE